MVLKDVSGRELPWRHLSSRAWGRRTYIGGAGSSAKILWKLRLTSKRFAGSTSDALLLPVQGARSLRRCFSACLPVMGPRSADRLLSLSRSRRCFPACRQVSCWAVCMSRMQLLPMSTRSYSGCCAAPRLEFAPHSIVVTSLLCRCGDASLLYRYCCCCCGCCCCCC